MVAELKIEMEKMKERMQELEDKAMVNEKAKLDLQEAIDENHAKFNSKVFEINDKLQEFEDAKIEIIDVLGPKFAEVKAQTDGLLNDARRKFQETDDTMANIMKTAQNKFDDIDKVVKEAEKKYHEVNQKTEFLYIEANKKFIAMDEELKKTGIGRHSGNNKKSSFLPDKMMIPKTFDNDVGHWRKWTDDVTKYFDEGKEGIKVVMEDVARLEQEVTREVLQEAARNYPQVLSDLEQWKHLYRALEKLVEGEAAKVVSTVKEENGFEAWRQLHLRFEPELEAQKNVVLMDLHNIEVATTIEETKNKMVELRVRITKAENILGVVIQEIQKKTALLQIIDPITRQHTARVKGGFEEFYVTAMNFANNAGVAAGLASAPKAVNAVKDKAEDHDGHYDQYENDCETIDAMGKGAQGGCRNCGDMGHWARERPKPLRGKGNAYNPKGKGEGKGAPVTCYNCLEFGHFARDCPKPKGFGKGKGDWVGGKKGSYGKGQYGKSKGKGPAWVNGLAEVYYNGPAEDWDASWHRGNSIEPMCSLKMVIPKKDNEANIEDKPNVVKMVSAHKRSGDVVFEDKNRFAELVNDENDADDSQEDEATLASEINIEKRRKRMPRVRNWKNMNAMEHTVQHGCSARCGLCPGGVGPDLMKATLHEVCRGKPGSMTGVGAVSTCGGTCRAGASHVVAPAGDRARDLGGREIRKPKVNMIKTIELDSINKVTADGIWEEIELAVDSGASESVVPPTMPESVPTVEGSASRRGVMYEVASGHQLPNEGEKRFNAVTEEGSEKKMTIQVCDVNQGLLSVAKMVAAGNRVVFDQGGSYVESMTTGDRTWLRERGGMFIMKLWVKRPF